MTERLKKWDEKKLCHNYGVHCMNNAVSQVNDGDWYCLDCQIKMIDEFGIDEVEVDNSLEICQTELELQSQ